MTASHHYLESLQEAETSLWVKAGLDRLEEHVRATGGSDELLNLIDYLSPPAAPSPASASLPERDTKYSPPSGIVKIRVA